ncbi:MAG TPA: penicillin acylase family protein, partial [Longimicrobiaceae bacterium]|nr:penicillin acylase family protein [Longimicrobiaceae bacterium]
MRKLVILAAAAAAFCLAPTGARAQSTPSAQELARWKETAANVTITRDDWGIAHVHGKTDADAVFGMEYAQAEDDFNRVETNYLVALGRLAEAEGESAIWQDLRARLYMSPDTLKALYARSPGWLQELMVAFADGLNYYMYTHPEVEPRAITHYEPWMALSFSEGSIGGDIERMSLRDLAAFYGSQQEAMRVSMVTPLVDGYPPEPTGSNGIAYAPKKTLDGHAILYINPHTSFYFRSELQMSSDEGLDAYGAVTWGQFFIYQGFNPTAGWMHTSSGVDNIDQFLETPVEKDGRMYYRYGDELLPMGTRQITVDYRTPSGMAHRTFTAYFTQHGPVYGKRGDRWLTYSMMFDPVNALIQSYARTKAKNITEFEKLMELHTNSSNNTVYADAEGNIAYFHSNYIPRRDTSFNWLEPVNGSDPRTAYDGVLEIDETPNSINPSVGWVYNSNNWPWSASGPDSPKRSDYPVYVERGTEETPRGRHALRILPGLENVTMTSLTAAAFDSYLPAFATLIPPLLKAYDALPASSPQKAKLAKQITVLRPWDYRWGINSVPTSLAVFYGTDL